MMHKTKEHKAMFKKKMMIDEDDMEKGMSGKREGKKEKKKKALKKLVKKYS